MKIIFKNIIDKMKLLITFLLGSKNYYEANILGGMFAATVSFVATYVYNDPLAIGVLAGAYIFDFVSALYKCKVNKIPIKSSLLPRFIYHLVFICALLSFSWYLSQTNLMFYFLPSLIYGGCMSQQLLSILENLGEARVIDIKFLDYYRQLIMNRYIRMTETKKINDDTVVIEGVQTKQNTPENNIINQDYPLNNTTDLK